MYNLNLLSIFKGIVEAGGLTKASKILHLSQPALSKQLNQLEEIYEIKLAERSRKGFFLTEAGEKLYVSCKTILSEFEKSKELLQVFKKDPQGDLTLGTNIDLGLYLFLSHIPILKNQFPKLNIHNHMETNSSYLLPLIKAGKIDIACVDQIYLARESVFYTISIDTKSVFHLMGASSYLGQHQKIDRIENIFDHTFIDLGPDKPLVNWLYKKCEIKPSPFRNYLYANNSLALDQYLREGLGISFCPEYLFKEDLKCKRVQKILPKRLVATKKDFLCCLETRRDFPKVKAVMEYFQRVLK